MSLVKLYVDEDAVEQIVVEGLRAAGIDVLTTLEAGGERSRDEVQLRFAVEHGRAIYSLNVKDFARLHARSSAVTESTQGYC